MKSSNVLQSDAIEQNNLAVALIATGRDYAGAMMHLSTALKISKQCSMAAEQQPQNSRSCHQMASLDMCMVQTPCKPLIRRESDVSEQYYIHRQGICIPPCSDSQPHQDEAVVSAVVMFNLALLLQLSALDGGCKRRGKLRKAAKLYQLLGGLHQLHRFENNVGFAMATMNNLGLIYKQLKDNASANYCFETLLSSLMFSVFYGKHQQAKCVDLSGFHRNVSRFTSALSGVAPAA
jgi:hypothetical protein